MSPSPEARRERVRVVLLAAGAARRMGRPKQLMQLQGRPLLLHAVDEALATGCAVDVILGAEAQRCRELLAGVAGSLRILMNEAWEEGMAASLRLGVSSAPDDCEALLVMLCDQPRIPREHHIALIDAWLAGAATIVASEYAGQIGVPAIFAREYFAHLLQLRGDRGARALLLQKRQHVHSIPCPAAALDIDRPEDLAALNRDDLQ